MSNNHLTAVLPVKIKSWQPSNDLDRLVFLLLPSFERFWINKDSLEFLVITTEQDKKTIVKKLNKKRYNFKITVISENDLCPVLVKKSGWWKQQILKLVSSKIIETDLFITLDADVILRRPILYEDLFCSKKPIYRQENASLHWDWWIGSKSILKSNVSFQPNSIMMGVTPEILYRDICIDLFNEIGLRNNTCEVSEFLYYETVRHF